MATLCTAGCHKSATPTVKAATTATTATVQAEPVELADIHIEPAKLAPAVVNHTFTLQKIISVDREGAMQCASDLAVFTRYNFSHDTSAKGTKFDVECYADLSTYLLDAPEDEARYHEFFVARHSFGKRLLDDGAYTTQERLHSEFKGHMKDADPAAVRQLKAELESELLNP